MASCSGKCLIQEVEHKVVKFSWTSNDKDCPKAKKKHLRLAINKVVDGYKASLLTGCPTSNCKCVKIKDKKPTDWTEWSDCLLNTSYSVGECFYTVTANLKLRTRAYDGFCLPKKLGKLANIPKKDEK